MSNHSSPSLRQLLPSLTGGVWGWVFLFTFVSCSHTPSSIPASFTDTSDSLALYPDYRDVVVPPNIAPLNFMVTDEAATEFVAKVGEMVCGASDDGKFELDSTAWRNLLTDARGKDVSVEVYAHRPAGWVRYRPYTFSVAEEEIDPYLSYRLIEPGYELYRQLGLYQRNLTNFDETVIYENNRSFEDNENHCNNCHNYQAYDTRHMLFHVRAAHGGTVIVEGDKAHKIAIKHDSILGAGVYPSWHPTLPLVAFSSNKTGQVFHMKHAEKIEVLDEASDLILYDVEKNTVQNILRSDDQLETFPCWSPDGRRLYYCSAKMPAALLENYVTEAMVMRYDSLLYNIYCLDFDPATRRFSAPQLVLDAAAMGKSASVPRISPDGRYLLFTLGDYGQFHIWHKSADLWMLDLQDLPSMVNPFTMYGKPVYHAWETPEDLYPLTEANSPDADSYHGWSSNGRWIVVASRRDDGNFSRVYISYFDRKGRAHRAFLLPQRDPEYNVLLLKSYNVPELTCSALSVTTEELNHVVLHTDAETATFLPAE